VFLSYFLGKMILFDETLLSKKDCSPSPARSRLSPAINRFSISTFTSLGSEIISSEQSAYFGESTWSLANSALSRAGVSHYSAVRLTKQRMNGTLKNPK